MSYTISPSASSAGYTGIWAGEVFYPGFNTWLYQCVGFVIESSSLNGVVEAKYISGDRVKAANGFSGSVKPSVTRWVGKVEGDSLQFVKAGYRYDLHLVDANHLSGAYTTRDGKGEARLSRR